MRAQFSASVWLVGSEPLKRSTSTRVLSGWMFFQRSGAHSETYQVSLSPELFPSPRIVEDMSWGIGHSIGKVLFHATPPIIRNVNY